MNWDYTTRDVSLQDQITNPMQSYLMTEEKTDITLTSPTTLLSNTINVSAGRGITDTKTLIIIEGPYYYQTDVQSVNVNEITLYEPVPTVFSTNATIKRGSKNLAVKGNVIPVYFYFYPQITVPLDINTIHVSSIHSVGSDFSKFMGISALTNGLLVYKQNRVSIPLNNYRNNQAFFHIGATVEFTDKGGGGSYGTLICKKLNSMDNNGIALRMWNDCKIVVVVRDDLTNLETLYISVSGHYTEGEQ